MMKMRKIAFGLSLCLLVCALVSCSLDEDGAENIATEIDEPSVSKIEEVTYETDDETMSDVSETVCLTASETEINAQETEEKSDTEATSGVVSNIHALDREKDYIANGESLFSFKLKNSDYYIIQGGYFDGENYYVAAIKKYGDGYEDARILVMDASGRRLRESEVLPLDHANSITYNDRIDKLVVAHCQSVDGHYYRYSFVDPETLTVTESGDKDYPFFAIAYSSEKEMYASGEWGGETLDLWNADFEHIKSVGVSQPGSLSQGVDCDGEGIYFVRSSQNGYSSEIRIYNWNCKLYCRVDLALPDGVEPESINVIDGEVYVIGTDWTRGCGVAYKITFEEK